MLEIQQNEVVMKEYFGILSECPLFHNMEPSALDHILTCLDARLMKVPCGNFVFCENSPSGFAGVVLSGAVQIVRDDYYGNRSVLAFLQPGEMFAEVFSFAGLETMPVSAVASKDSLILLLDCRQILNTCENTCQFHSQLLKNLLQDMARKSLALHQKIHYMSQKTTKEKLIAYLLDQAKQNNSAEFVIPYDRQALADYLGVDRSAMSAEIGKLKKAEQLDTKGSWFHIRGIGR